MSTPRRLGMLALVFLVAGFGRLHAQEDNPEAARLDGEQALVEGRLDDAVTAFQRCLRLSPRHPFCAYDLACAYARKRDTSKALQWLENAANWGFEDVDHILKDPDLAGVRSHPVYRQIVEDIQNRRPASKPRPYVAPEELDRALELVVMLRSELGSGAGILVSHEGDRVYLATANHVVRQGGEEAQKIEVQLKGLAPRWHRARLLPALPDSDLDLAIVAVDGVAGPDLNFCALPLHLGGGDSGLRRGDAVFPVGYPGGILWAMPLSPDHASQVVPGQISFESQFVRVGFSGGALLNKRGAIVGMITADEPPLGRAVPIAMVLEAARTAGYPVQLSKTDDGGTSPLHAAAKAGDVAAVRRLLASCADPNAADDTGRTALHEAAVQGSAEVIRLLRDAGARLHAWAVIDMKSRDEWGTPVHFAAEHGKAEALKALLIGGDVDLETLYRWVDDEQIGTASTALHFAAQHDHAAAIEVLLAAGAALETRGREGLTPLGLAARHGALAAARVLLQRGASLGAEGGRLALTPLQLAAEAGQVDMLKLLVEHGADVNASDPSNAVTTALHAAAAAGRVEAAAFLISQKAVVDAPGYQGNTPLYAAAQTGSAAMVELLLANGANANAMAGIGQGSGTPIQKAAERKGLEVLQAFVKAGADIGYLLHTVLAAKKIEAARILIQAGADVLLKDAHGRQPLHIAAKEGMIEAVDLLLKRGAPIGARVTEGHTPLHLAASGGHLATLEVLIAANAPLNEQNQSGQTALFMAVAAGQVEVVDRLLLAGADANKSDAITPVAQAATQGPPGILAALLAAGADPNRAGAAAESPLTLAAKGRGGEKKVELLLKAGAKVMAEGEKTTAFHAALAGDADAAVRIIALLLEAGAPVDARDEDARTPLHFAVPVKNIEAVRALVAGGASVHAVDKCGATPLWYVLAGRAGVEAKALAVSEILVTAGADVNARSTCTEGTLVSRAEALGYSKVRQLLLSKGAKPQEP